MTCRRRALRSSSMTSCQAALVSQRMPIELDRLAPRRYSLVSTPAGPLSQDMLSLGGFFIGIGSGA